MPLSPIRCGGPSATRTRTAAKRAFRGPFVPLRQASVRHFAWVSVSSALTERTLRGREAPGWQGQTKCARMPGSWQLHTTSIRYFNSSPEVIRLVMMMYVRYPLSLRNVEDLLAERGIDISHETVRFWWNRFGPMFAAEIRKKRVAHMRWRCQSNGASSTRSARCPLASDDLRRKGAPLG